MMKFFSVTALALGLAGVSQAYQAPRYLPPPLPFYAPVPVLPAHLPRGYGRPPVYPAPRYFPQRPARIPMSPPQRSVQEAAPARSADIPAQQEVLAEQPQAGKPPASSASLNEHQQAFLHLLTPIVEGENQRLLALRQQVRQLARDAAAGHAQEDAQTRLRALGRKYRIEGDPVVDPDARRELVARIDVIPTELALAQAVNESGWGTSRFAREGNNLFGIWTYDKSKGMVPKGRAAGATHLVRRFDSLEASVRYYLHNLNSHPAYGELRDLRAGMRSRGAEPSGLVLAAGLTRYSAKGEVYVRLIRELIQRYSLAAASSGIAPEA
jgi:Bax protein